MGHLPVSINWGALFVGVVIVRALLLFNDFGSGPEFWKLPFWARKYSSLETKTQVGKLQSGTCSGATVARKANRRAEKCSTSTALLFMHGRQKNPTILGSRERL